MIQRNWVIGRLPIRRVVSAKAVSKVVVLLCALIMALASAVPAYADHNSTEVMCPGPILEGKNAFMRVSRKGYKIEYVRAFTYHGDYSASGDDFVNYNGDRFEEYLQAVFVPVVTLDDDRPEINETFTIGFWVEEMWHGCVITIVDDDMPEITSVAITSKPVEGLFYRYGESIDVTVSLDQEVEVEGTPLLALQLGDGDASAWRGARYLTGSGSNSLIFRYQVQAHDMDYDGISVRAGATNDDRTPAYGFSGSIYAKGTKAPIDYTHSGINNADKHYVDGRPYVQNVAISSAPPDGWEAYRANQNIELTFTFNTEVAVQGSLTADLLMGYKDQNWDEARRAARYTSGSGTDTLVFSYTVQPGDMDRNGVGIAGGSPGKNFGGDGTIVAEGTDVEFLPWYFGREHSPSQRVDTEIPIITSVTLESQPNNGEAYSAGETMSVAVAFNEAVTVSGGPVLELDIGGAARQAALVSDAPRSTSTSDRKFGDRLVFQYQIVDGDTDSDGVGISANSLKLNGGGIYDRAGNAASLDHSAIAADSNHKVGAA